MDKAELLAEFKAQLDLFDKYQSYIDKAKGYADKFNPAVVEKVITDNTEKIREVANVLDPLIADMRAVVASLDEAKTDVQKGVEKARMALEELELRQAIGELDDEEFDASATELRGEIESADERVAGIDEELDEYQSTLDRWVGGRPELDESTSAGEDDLLDDLDDDGGIDLDEDEDEDDAFGSAGGDMIDDEAFNDDGPGDAGVHAHKVEIADDVSAVFGDDPEEDPLEAGDDVGISFSDDELGDLGDDGLAAAPVEEAAAAGEGRGVLILAEGTAEEHVFQIGTEVISLGRGRDNNIQVKNDSKVSRYHCKVFKRGGNYFIEDNKSANGTLVDGELITEKRLIGGEEVIIGETLFRFRIHH